MLLGLALLSVAVQAQNIAHPPHGDTQRVVNGEEAPVGKYPWIVALEARVQGDEGAYSCGGTLIAPGYVLTAAHCYYPARTSDIGAVYYGSHRSCFSSYCEDSVKIAEVTIHPKYNTLTLQHDIAILKLARPITTITPVALAEAGYATDQDFGGDGSAITLGWGVDNTATESMPDKLQLGNVNLVNRNQCGRNFGYSTSDIMSGMVCANSPANTDSCQGDSGGPLFVPSRGVQVGVVSWGIGCGADNYPGVYTDVGTYYDWVQGLTGNYVAPPSTPAPPVVECECQASWTFDGATYAGCQFTPDDANSAWCYTVGECTGSEPSGLSPGDNWVYCSADDDTNGGGGGGNDDGGNVTPTASTGTAESTSSSTQSTSSSTPLTDAPGTNPPATDAPGTNPPATDAPTAPTEPPTKEPPVTDGPDDSNGCTCKDSWEWDGATYSGCTATPDDPTIPWCYVTSNCKGAVASLFQAGSFWNICDGGDGGGNDDGGNVTPAASTGTAESTSSSSTSPSPLSVCGSGSYAEVMANGICPSDTHELVDSADDCEMAALELGLADITAKRVKGKKNPKGCYFLRNKLYFNSRGKADSKNQKKQAICCSLAEESSSTNAPWTGAYGGGYDATGGGGGGNACECQASWQFGGDTYEQCAFTPDDPNNSWCYTEGGCDGSSASDSYVGSSWSFCNVKGNKRAAFGAVKHVAAASAGAASEGSSDDGLGGGGGGGAPNGIATAAAGVIAAVFVVGALVVGLVHKRQTPTPATGRRDAADGTATAEQVENGGIAIPTDADAAVDGLERAGSYHDALAVPPVEAAAQHQDFAATQFVLDAAAAGSFKIKSVRRPNPAYRSSIFVENTATEGV